MEKRAILAITLSLLVLWIWSGLMPKTQPIADKPVTTSNLAPASQPQVTQQASLPVSKEPLPEESSFKIALDNTEFVFSEPSAALKEIIFNNYQAYKLSLGAAFFIPGQPLTFKKQSSSGQELSFVAWDQNKKITKHFIFSNNRYGIELEIEIQNLSNAPLEISLPLILGVLDFSFGQANSRYQDITVALNNSDKVLHPHSRKDAAFEDIKFIGLRDRYFCAIIQPSQNKYAGFIKKSNAGKSEVGIESEKFSISAGESIKQKFHIYMGPQDLRKINNIKPAWAAIIHYGMFDLIAQMLLQLLNILYGLVHNWGWAIIILSILIYALFFPLTLKQIRSMKEMQALQPRIEEIKKAYKDNPQKLNKEIMELYREHKVNPLGGCLPLILQMPIFFALYQALMRSIVLKGARFLWIKDLSEPDRFLILPTSLPVLGNEVNILPIIMAIGMFFQQKLSMSKTAGSSAEQQKMMLILFPFMFGLIFYHMPAGLVLYWFVNSTLMLLYQMRAGRVR